MTTRAITFYVFIGCVKLHSIVTRLLGVSESLFILFVFTSKVYRCCVILLKMNLQRDKLQILCTRRSMHTVHQQQLAGVNHYD